MSADTFPNRRAAPGTDERPWWRYAMVWVVIAGPLAALVAGFVTLGIAWTHIDPVISGPAQNAAQQRPPNGPDAPAQSARNHAATPKQ